MSENFIITSMSFKSKMECLEHFKELIKEDTFELINENTVRVPLNKVNELLEEDYIYVNIISETESEDGEYKNTFENEEEIWIRDFCYVEEYIKEYIDSFFSAQYVFLFKEKNEQYKFLGLYKKIDIRETYIKWERKEENIIVLDKSKIVKLIQNIKYSYIKEYINDREKLKEVLKKYGDRYEYLPDNLKNDRELCLISLESTKGYACEFAGKKLLNNREFAEKVLKKYPFCLEYFSDSIKDDFEICKNTMISYRDMSKRIRKNKELALKIIKEQPYDIKYIDKEVRKDKDICEEYWKYVKESMDYACFSNICSVIGIDTFGNEIIDTFLKIEKGRHSEEIIAQYEEKTELVQFVKTGINISYQETNPSISMFDKKIFDKDLKPLIILIGEKENIISTQIKKEYNLSDNICILEIYKQDINTHNPKLITEDIDEIINLLRIVTYDQNSNRILLHDDYLYKIKEHLKHLNESTKKRRIKIYKFEGSIKEVKKQISEMNENLSAKACMIQLVYNQKIDIYTINNIYNMLHETNSIRYIRYYSSHMCNIKNIELIIMIVD